MDQHAHPLPSVPTVDKRCSTVLRGVFHEGRLIGGGARNQEPDGDTRCRDSDLDRFGRQYDVIPTSCVLMYYIEMYVDSIYRLGDPCLSLYTLEG